MPKLELTPEESASLAEIPHPSLGSGANLYGSTKIFPDYQADTEGLAFGDGCVTWWGTIRVTFQGPLLGVPPTGRTATIPGFSVFEFRDEQLSKERFFFDLVSLCEGIGASVDDVTSALAGLRAAAA